MTRIVAIGECMVEMAPVATEGQFRLGYAGDTLNTAWYLRRLLGTDDQIDYFTAVGIDSIKRWARPFSYQDWPDNLLPSELLEEEEVKLIEQINSALGVK